MTLVLEASCGADVTRDELHRRLVDGLESSPTSCPLERVLLDFRIPAADIDAFATTRGWSSPPDATVRVAAGAGDALQIAQWLSGVVDDVADPARTSVMVVRERTVFDTAGADDCSAVTMVVQNWKRPDLSVAEYVEHWRDRHGPLVHDLGPDMGFRRYVQSYRTESPELDRWAAGRSWRSAPDGGMTQVWWESAEAMAVALASAAGQCASTRFAEDERNFIHPPAMTAFLARSRLIRPSRAARPTRRSPETAQDHQTARA